MTTLAQTHSSVAGHASAAESSVPTTADTTVASATVLSAPDANRAEENGSGPTKPAPKPTITPTTTTGANNDDIKGAPLLARARD